MKKLLLVFSIVVTILFSFYLVISPVYSDELDDINKKLADLEQALSASQKATAPLESQLTSLRNQLTGIENRISFIETDIVNKKKLIDTGYQELEKQKEVFNRAVRNFYIESYSFSPLLVFISSNDAADVTRNLAYRKKGQDQDKALITSIALKVSDLEQRKVNLEDEEKRLSSVKGKLAVEKAEIEKVVTGARNYQASLSTQISQLSAKQQQIIASKQSALSSSSGKSLDTQTASSACGVQALSSYPSTIRVKFPDGHIETMPFEDQYLKGLGEMPRAWSSESNSQEAFKSQVVAARTYALFKMVRSSCRDFDVYSTTADQVYSGGTGDSNWNSAVDGTKGQFLQNGGSVIIAYYSANSGGHTLSPSEAWNAGGGFPSGIDDSGSDGKPNGDLNARCIGTLRWEYHYNVGRNGKVQYNDTCPGGDINNSNSPMTNSEVEDIVDATIWALKKGSVPENSLNHDQIKSDLGGEAIGSIQSISASIADNKYTNNIHVVGSNQTRDFSGDQAQTFRLVFNVRSPDQFLIPSTTYGAHYVKFDILSSGDAHGTQGPGWYFYTYGYGHRIGLDQEGALGMASQGKGYTEILSHYYQGTTITPNNYSGSVQ